MMSLSRIEELWAWIGITSEGDEGVLSAKMAGDIVPLIHITRLGVEMQRAAAQQMADLGIEVRLVCFTNRTDLETLT